MVKIARFISQDGETLYGLVCPETPDMAYIIEEPFFEHISVTDTKMRIGRMLSPLNPVNIFCLGLNYGDHATETGITRPTHPVLFIKSTTSIIGHGAPILLPKAGPEEVDFEAELAIVIGKKCKNIAISEVADYIFGYTCANDVSARDWQIFKQMKQWARGKSFDSFCPLGPYIVTKDEIRDPNNLRIRAVLNGRVMQDSNTSKMIFDVYSIVSDLSWSMTLLPGTVILTGTPEGVGFTRQPPVYLKENDVITVCIEGIGELTNPVKHET